MTPAGPPPIQPSLRFGVAALMILMLAQWAVYFDSFRILPASDDFPIVNEIHRGNARGVGVFFSESIIQVGYRPLKSLAIWIAAQVSPGHPMVIVRVLSLLMAALYAFGVLLWVRVIRLGRAGTVVALTLAFLHPVLTASIGSCDGIDTVASSALLWLGAWFIWCYRDRIVPAGLAAVACFVVGIGFKENLFALVPLSIVVIAFFWTAGQRRNWSFVAITGVLLVLAIANLQIRNHVIRGGLEGGVGMLADHPKQYVENAAVFATGLLFFGDTIWVFVNRSPAVLALVAGAMLAAAATVVGGLWLRARRDDSRDIKRTMLFLAIGLIVASGPTSLGAHISEMYVPPIVCAFALLAGMSADGWIVARPWTRFAVGVVAGLSLAFSVQAIRHKITGLRDVGDRSEAQLRQILALLPPDAEDLSVAALFEASELPPRRTYSVFRMGDENLLVHKDVLEWKRPGRRLLYLSPGLAQTAEFDRDSVNIVLRWDAPTQRFLREK